MTSEQPEMTDPESTVPEGAQSPEVGEPVDVPEEDLDPSRLPTEAPEVEEPAGYDEHGQPTI